MPSRKARRRTWTPSPRSTHTASSLRTGSPSAFRMGSWETRKSGPRSFQIVFLPPSVSLTTNGAHRHLNIGAGRIVWQDIVRIDVAIKKRQFHKNEKILASFQHAKDTNGRLHLLGLVRPSSIHQNKPNRWRMLDLGRRCPLAQHAPVCAARDRERGRRPTRLRALPRRRTRYRAALRGEICAGTA